MGLHMQTLRNGDKDDLTCKKAHAPGWEHETGVQALATNYVEIVNLLHKAFPNYCDLLGQHHRDKINHGFVQQKEMRVLGVSEFSPNPPVEGQQTTTPVCRFYSHYCVPQPRQKVLFLLLFKSNLSRHKKTVHLSLCPDHLGNFSPEIWKMRAAEDKQLHLYHCASPPLLTAGLNWVDQQQWSGSPPNQQSWQQIQMQR